MATSGALESPPSSAMESESGPGEAKRREVVDAEAEEAEATGVCDLPDEILQICFARLPAAWVGCLGGVCRRWRRVGEAGGMCRVRKLLGLRRACTFVFDNEYVDGEYQGLKGRAIDAESRLQRAISPLLCPRRLQYGAAAADGLVYILGGRSPLMCHRPLRAWIVYSRLDAYEPLSDSWREMRPMAVARYGFAAGACVDPRDGRLKIIVAGGCDGAGQALSSAEVFDARTERWEPIPSMRTVCGPCTGEFFQGKYYVHQANAGSDVVDDFEFSSGRWGAHEELQLSNFGFEGSSDCSGTSKSVVVDV